MYNPRLDYVDSELDDFARSLSDSFKDLRLRLDNEERRLLQISRQLRKSVFHGTECKKAKLEQLDELKDTINKVSSPSLSEMRQQLLKDVELNIHKCEDAVESDSAVSRERIEEIAKNKLEGFKSELLKSKVNISEVMNELFFGKSSHSIVTKAEKIFPIIIDAVLSQFPGDHPHRHQSRSFAPQTFDSRFHDSSSRSQTESRCKDTHESESGICDGSISERQSEICPAEVEVRSKVLPPPQPPVLTGMEIPEDLPFTPPKYEDKKPPPICAKYKKGKGANELSLPKGIAIDESDDEEDSKFFVADSNNHLVRVFTMEGEHKQDIAIPEMQRPFGVATSEDFIYVTDADCHKVFQFRMNNFEAITNVGGKGCEESQFSCPKGICVGKDAASEMEYVYVADSDNDRVCVFYRKLTFKQSLTHDILKAPLDVSIVRGVLVVLNLGENCVHFFNREENGLKHIKSIISQGEHGDCYGPSFFDVDPHFNVVISDSRKHRVRIFDKDGELKGEFGQNGDGEGDFKCPSGIKVTKSGVIIVVSMNKNTCLQMF